MTHFILDCDDVLLDWQNAFAAFLAARDIRVDPEGPQSWDLSEWIGCSDEAARSWVAHFNGSASFGKLAAMPGARDVVWALRDAGHTISVLTACGDAVGIPRMRVQNLATVFGSDTLRSITILDLGASKFDALVRAATCYGEGIVFVEDSFRHAQSGVEVGIKSYCLRRSHNRRDEAENPASGVIWIDDLREVAARHINKETVE